MSGFRRLARGLLAAAEGGPPPSALEAAKRALLDCCGCMIAGAGTEAGRAITEMTRAAGGTSESTVVGGAFRTGASGAALANGTLAHALDFDDISFDMPGHPSAPVFPAALSLGERDSLSGEAVLRAALLGIETECLLGRLTDPELSRRGWHPTGVLGAPGAAACAGLLLGLDEQKLAHALGTAASLAGGLKANFGSSTKPLHAGEAARAGVTAAELALRGWTAGGDALEGEAGFLAAFAEPRAAGDLFEDIADPYEVVSPGLVFKPYPSCGGTHPAIRAMLELVGEAHLNAEDVKRIRCRITPFVRSVATRDEPRTPSEARFSIPFCLAVCALEGAPRLEHFAAGTLESPGIRELMTGVEVIVAPELSADGFGGCATVLEVLCSDGRELAREADASRGQALDPVGDEELVAKFRSCAGGALSEARVAEVVEKVLAFEQLSDVGELMDLLRERNG